MKSDVTLYSQTILLDAVFYGSPFTINNVTDMKSDVLGVILYFQAQLSDPVFYESPFTIDNVTDMKSDVS